MATIRQWINYWVIDPFWGFIDFSTFQVLRCFPLNYVSNIGALIGRLARNRFKQAAVDAKENLHFLFPELSEINIHEISNLMWRNIARTLTEMAVLDKFNLGRDVKEFNLEIFNGLDRTRPVIFLFPHLGNWELLAISVINQGFKLNVIFEHIPNRFQRRLLVSSRKRIGYELITPDYSGTRKIFKALSSGEAIGLAMDEFKNGKIVSPAFGEVISQTSNIKNAIGLARRFNAPLVMGFCKRVEGIRFDITYSEPIKLDESIYCIKSDNEIAGLINHQCQQWVRENPEQWYMLHRARLT